VFWAPLLKGSRVHALFTTQIGARVPDSFFIKVAGHPCIIGEFTTVVIVDGVNSGFVHQHATMTFTNQGITSPTPESSLRINDGRTLVDQVFFKMYLASFFLGKRRLASHVRSSYFGRWKKPSCYRSLAIFNR